MIDEHKVIAVVPARGGSKGLPGKNLRMLSGRPLVAWPISAACQSEFVDRVIISTDDSEIAEAAKVAGAELPFMRPPELASDTASSMDVVRHALMTLADSGELYDYVVLLEPTSPLTEAKDIDSALSQLHGALSRADAIVGISRIEATHPEYSIKQSQEGLISPLTAPDFRSLRRRQEIEELYFLEGSLYASTTEAFLRIGSFYHERTIGYEVPRWKSLEIDEYLDLICAEAVMKHRDEIGRFEKLNR